MLRGISITASALAAQAARQDVVANNLANLNTTAFKGQRGRTASFAEVLLQRVEETGSAPVGGLRGGASLEVNTDWRQGPLEPGGGPLDLALEGRGWLAVQTPAGIRYTRDGGLHLDADGYLVNERGEMVLGQGGPIQVGEGKLTISPAGAVSVDGMFVDTLRIVDLPGEPVRDGGNQFMGPAGAAPPPGGALVRQGYLERSNVDLAGELVEGLAALRAYQANARLLAVQDDLLGRAVREIGSLR